MDGIYGYKNQRRRSNETRNDASLLLNSTLERMETGNDIEYANASSNLNIDETFQNEGLEGLIAAIKGKLDNWENVEMNIAVTGRSGVGKKSFVNAIRGDLDESHSEYAKVGEREFTGHGEAYKHPNNKLLRFWILPSPGTEKYPRESFVKNQKIGFQTFDMFLIMACDRITEDETWLAKEVKKLGKPFLFIRSKVDSQIDSDAIRKRKADKEHNPLQVIEAIREDCKQNLKEIVGSPEDIYLINNNKKDQVNLDFDQLLCRLVDGFDLLKAEVFMYTLKCRTSELLKEKIASLHKRIHQMGIISSIPGAVPIPGPSSVANALLIANEIRIYRKQLGLSDQDLRLLAEMMKLPLELLKEKYSLKTLGLANTGKGLIALIGTDVVGSSVGLVFPFIGMPIGAFLSLVTTVKLLRSILSICEKDAKIVLQLVLEQTKCRIMHLQY